MGRRGDGHDGTRDRSGPPDPTAGAGRERRRDPLAGRLGAPPPGRGSRVPAVPERYRYTMAELEELTGLPARTVRYYISQGLLPPAHGRGPTATYDLGHLLRLRMVLLLRDRYLPLAEIKEQLGGLSDAEIEAMLGVETRPPEDRWRRIALHPDVELHVRDRTGPDRGSDLAFERAVDDIVGLAQPVLDRLEGDR